MQFDITVMALCNILSTIWSLVLPFLSWWQYLRSDIFNFKNCLLQITMRINSTRTMQYILRNESLNIVDSLTTLFPFQTLLEGSLLYCLFCKVYFFILLRLLLFCLKWNFHFVNNNSEIDSEKTKYKSVLKFDSKSSRSFRIIWKQRLQKVCMIPLLL